MRGKSATEGNGQGDEQSEKDTEEGAGLGEASWKQESGQHGQLVRKTRENRRHNFLSKGKDSTDKGAGASRQRLAL